jgi:hypothetical protein
LPLFQQINTQHNIIRLLIPLTNFLNQILPFNTFGNFKAERAQNGSKRKKGNHHRGRHYQVDKLLHTHEQTDILVPISLFKFKILFMLGAGGKNNLTSTAEATNLVIMKYFLQRPQSSNREYKSDLKISSM